MKRKLIRKKIVKEGYGTGFSFTGGAIRGMGRGGGFGGASNLGGPNMMYTYEIKPLNHTLEPKPSEVMNQIEAMHIGSKVSGTPIRANNIKYDKKITGTLQQIKLAEDGSVKYYVVFDEATAMPVRVEPTSIKLIVEEPIKYFGDASTDAPSERKKKMEKAALNRKLVSESFDEFLKKQDKLEEGVADKYAEKEFHMVDDKAEEFENKHRKEELLNQGLKEIGRVEYSKYTNRKFNPAASIFENPKSLKNLGSMARAVISKDGNMWIGDNTKVVHWDILNVLISKGIYTKEEVKEWEVMDQINFLTVQRVGESNEFAIGESYTFAKMHKDPELRKEQISKFAPFIEAVKKKFPQYVFHPEQFRVVAKEKMTPEEREKAFALANESKKC